MKYENLLDEAATNDLYVFENVNFKSKADGLINGNVIGINRNVRSIRKRTCVLAEELGHYYTSTGDILNQADIQNRKQELHARSWAYNRLVGLRGIIDCYKSGYKTLYEMAEHLEVTEEFLTEALNCYRRKYGLCKKIENYIIYFEPYLCVFEQL